MEIHVLYILELKKKKILHFWNTENSDSFLFYVVAFN